MTAFTSEWSFAMSIPFWLAMAGWGFTYLNSRSLAKQSESNSIVSAVDKMLQEISDENYKFWRDADFSSETHDLKCQLFQSYIGFRCNFIEARIAALCKKCRNKFLYDGDVDKFSPEAISLIGKIREVSTLDSERSSNPDAADRRRRILLINKYAMDLHGILASFMESRFRSPFDFSTTSRYGGN